MTLKDILRKTSIPASILGAGALAVGLFMAFPKDLHREEIDGKDVKIYSIPLDNAVALNIKDKNSSEMPGTQYIDLESDGIVDAVELSEGRIPRFTKAIYERGDAGFEKYQKEFEGYFTRIAPEIKYPKLLPEGYMEKFTERNEGEVL